ncbi:hypothetical protein A243_10931 [Pseudomonas syringae pv. actinidiae ICMP 18883]|uniref:Uncharacterized protein n=1 Tax=Pseudomonas syringae pv. actinidiae ICMP 19096 TaxID=1194405 RepID=A0A656JRQ6_PSESF|nr:hypothetical protein A246_10646 [Pseudomonas syringae pv. actinidiae ICMP 19098]EPN35169.1 hypothetical protein A243_10931 [Pseudomonas syringae pv. actinidiae ICMP 18883]EPN48616.1 hypothetical protein A245_29785 [Pseudomonas syringae pv. actinidiae ICMP 19096]POD52910.1 hypothetical protein BKM15_13570 [Pseudomonas syringae pv. syringae]
MEDLTQDVRHVRKIKDLKQQETVFQSQWVFNEGLRNQISRESEHRRGSLSSNNGSILDCLLDHQIM